MIGPLPPYRPDLAGFPPLAAIARTNSVRVPSIVFDVYTLDGETGQPDGRARLVTAGNVPERIRSQGRQIVVQNFGVAYRRDLIAVQPLVVAGSLIPQN